MSKEIRIGDIYQREGKHRIRICGCTVDGKYFARQILPAVKQCDLRKYFKPEMLVVGAVLRYPSGRTIQLVADRGNGHWDNEFPGELIELTATDLEELEAATHAAIVYSSVVSAREHGHPLRNPNPMRFVPRKMDDEPPE